MHQDDIICVTSLVRIGWSKNAVSFIEPFVVFRSFRRERYVAELYNWEPITRLISSDLFD